MTQAAINLHPRAQEIRRQKRPGAAFLILLFVYLTVWAYTGAHFMADTNVYAQAILRHQHGAPSPDYSLTTSNPFWDFGHILWRPFGWFCFVVFRPLTQSLTCQIPRAEVILTLLGINFLAALGCVILFFLLARRLIKNDWSALLATVGFFSADAFLNYAHSGNAYVVGLAFLVAGMYFSFSENTQGASPRWPFLPALMLALAVLFWFPYIFVLPAAMAAPLLLRGYDHDERRRTGLIIVGCAGIGVGVYAAAVALAGIRNLPELSQWILAAGHGQIQPGGMRALARLAFALPRSFVNLDQDGMWFKRYLVQDPYSPVTMTDLFRLSLWKLVLFYVAVGTVCFELWRHRSGKMFLVLLAGAVVPICVFAIFIFEAGSIERYLPLYPFVFLALGYLLGSGQTHRVSRILLLAALTLMIAVNLNAMRKGTLQARRAVVETRIQNLLPLLKPNDIVMAINEQDSLAEFRQDFPLDPINLDRDWQTYDVLEINTVRLATWRRDFADRVLATWQRGGVVWLPERFFHDRPNPEWNWVEGDDKRVRWTDLPSFFSQFEVGPGVGGDDGFVPLMDNPANHAILGPLSQAPPITDRLPVRSTHRGLSSPA